VQVELQRNRGIHYMMSSMSLMSMLRELCCLTKVQRKLVSLSRSLCPSEWGKPLSGESSKSSTVYRGGEKDAAYCTERERKEGHLKEDTITRTKIPCIWTDMLVTVSA